MKVWLVPAAAWVLCDLAYLSLLANAGFDPYDWRMIFGAQVVTVVACGAVIGAGAVVRRVTPGLCALALTVAAVAVFPVPVTYGVDDCHHTEGYTFAVTAPFVEVVASEFTVFHAFGTLVGCLSTTR